MSDITKKSLTEIIRLIKKKEIKSVEVTTSFIDNIKNEEILTLRVREISYDKPFRLSDVLIR